MYEHNATVIKEYNMDDNIKILIAVPNNIYMKTLCTDDGKMINHYIIYKNNITNETKSILVWQIPLNA
jgi:hypothetical protein